VAHRPRYAEIRRCCLAPGLLSTEAATFVDKILKGAKPSDLPVEQATTLELIVNLKTARPIKIPIPKELLLRADRVIE